MLITVTMIVMSFLLGKWILFFKHYWCEIILSVLMFGNTSNNAIDC